MPPKYHDHIIHFGLFLVKKSQEVVCLCGGKEVLISFHSSKVM